ncbi:MAG: NADH-quinone oxidoreductase subunit N [Candidatus Thermoplasmatota archaeon]|nr:NADH-quinone oxidoreductase subunit N [Candidatus Thermoplasmatota archaeon]
MLIFNGLGIIQFFLPEFILSIAGFLMLAMGIVTGSKKLYSTITMASLALSFIVELSFINASATVFNGSIIVNNFGTYFSLLFMISAMLISVPSMLNISRKPEIFYALLLFVTTGMLVAASSSNLIILFVSFEAVSTGTYVMSGFHKTDRTLEAATKYFFTGAVSTAIIVMGLSYYFEATGTFSLVSPVVTSAQAMLVAMILLVIGFGFKLAIFPMHQWAIDTYDGSENSVSAFLSTGSKLVAFMIMMRVFISGFIGESYDYYLIFTILAIVTMTYGNLSALSQTNLKRLLAYSSVAQAGYLILVFSATGYAQSTSISTTFVYDAIAAGMIYSLVYIFMKGGAFLAMNLSPNARVELSDISGLARKSPSLALAFSILLLSLAGIPFTGGFVSKLFLFLVRAYP